MKKKIIISLFLMFFIIFLYADNFSYEDNSFYFDEFISSILPGANLFPFFFENYTPDLIYMIEESNGFSIMDTPKPYYEGESPLNFNWYINGFNINSSLNSGSNAILPPISSSIFFDLKGKISVNSNNGLNFITRNYNKNIIKLNLSFVYPNMGSYFSFGPSLLNPNLDEREASLYNTRRKILSNSIINLSHNKRFKHSSLLMDFSYYNIKRQFNDFNKYDSFFKERGEFFSFLIDYKIKQTDGYTEFLSAINKSFRDNDFAELGRFPQETYGKNRFAFFTGIKIKIKGYKVISSVLYEKERITPFQQNFGKELTDNDGDGLFPFEKFGKFSSLTFNLKAERELKLQGINIKPFINMRTSVIFGKEKAFSENNIFFQSEPYLKLLSFNPFEKYKTLNNNFTTGISIKYKPENILNILSDIYFKFGYLGFEDKTRNIGLAQIGWDFGLSVSPGKYGKIFFSFGKTPYDLKENLNYFMESHRPFGKYFYINPENNMIKDIYKTTGPLFHTFDKDLKLPYSYSFLSLLSFKISKYFRFNVKTLYKLFKNTFWVKYKDYKGEYKNIEGYNLYLQNNYEEPYVLTNYDFDKDPFYGEFLMQFRGYKRNNWFLSLSFMAHIGMGYTSFGNGAIYNDIGNIDESMADPNTWINGFGRVDGDRAFVGKIFFGFYPFKNFSIGGSIKYRDGNPFAFINYYNTGKNIIFYYKTIQAENEKGIKGGPREDCVWDFSFKFKYAFRLGKTDADIYISVYNLLDIGNELSENVFSGGFRSANELQIPRSLRIGMNLRF